MPGLRIGEILVLFLHPLVGFFQGRVLFGAAPCGRPLGVDPGAHPLGDRLSHPLLQHARRRPEPLDGDHLAHILRIDAGIAQRDIAAIRVRNDRQRRQLLLVDQLREVIDAGAHRIVAISRPAAVAVTAQVRRDDVPVMAQFLGHPVPAAAMVPPAMQQDQGRRIGIAPIDIMKAHALRDIAVGSRSGDHAKQIDGPWPERPEGNPNTLAAFGRLSRCAAHVPR